MERKVFIVDPFVLLFLIILFILFNVGLFAMFDFNTIKINYTSTSFPIIKYDIKIIKTTHDMVLREKYVNDNYPNDRETNIYKLKLSKEEYANIKSLLDSKNIDESSLSYALSYISETDKVLYKENENGWFLYKIYDSNNDGIVTYREYGFKKLEDISNNE